MTIARAGVSVELTAAEGAAARICLLRGAQTLSSARRALSARRAAGRTCRGGRVVANRITTLRLDRLAGPQTLAVRLAAEANPVRVSTAVRVVR